MTFAALLAVMAVWTPATQDTYYGVEAHHHKSRRACRRHGDRVCRRHMVPAPVLKPLTPAGGPAPAPSPTPTPRPLPSRTGVDLDEWRVAPAYRELRAGAVEFNAANLGEDDHDFSVRDADGATLKAVPLAPGESAGVRLTLAAGTFTLYCSLPGHEELGMRARVTVR